MLLVLPAHAGVIPTALLSRLYNPCAPRACGGDPIPSYFAASETSCSPRMRG